MKKKAIVSLVWYGGFSKLTLHAIIPIQNSSVHRRKNTSKKQFIRLKAIGRWLNRAAQSLAEALRLVASKKLDVEFTELVTGYRLRTGAEASYVDIYLYDSLSSGAGYAVSVADAIAELLSDMKELLSSCDCGSACSKCLKHYRNQYVHGMLDRFAALQLLEWGVDGIKASPIKPETQINMIMPLANILKQSGCEITADSEITAAGRRSKKKTLCNLSVSVRTECIFYRSGIRRKMLPDPRHRT